MLKVLLVEDEVYMRKGIIKLIDWKKHGFDMIVEASNGQEALEILKKEKVDVVITDIKMPVMDGIELIKRISEEIENKPSVVIISGYNEFEFAKAAIRYGVNDYLLKPIDEVELIQTLERIKTRILNEREFDRRKSLYEYLKRNSKFLRIIEFNENQNIIDISDDKTFRWVGIGKKEDLQYYEDDLTVCENLLDIEREVNTRFASKGVGFKCFWDSFFNVIVIAETEFRNRKNQIVQAFEFILNKLNLQSMVYDEFKNSNDLNGFYRYLLKKLSFAQFYEKSGIIEANQIGDFEVYIEDKKFGSEIIKLIEERKIDQIKNKLLQFFDECQKKKISPEIIRGFIILTLLEIIDYFEIYQLLEEDGLKIILRSNLQKSKFIEKVMEILLQVEEYITQSTKFNSSSFMKKVELFIRENYNKDITIKSIAQQFYINPIYLGRMFKKYFNMPFNKYLHMLRIEQAKKLLLKTDKKIYEIAKEVGYNDTDYFALKFEEFVGKSPSKYRNSLTEEVNF
ncbi:response regulator [Caldicellulosiruptor morganii]|uniref:Response regulator n=1 Tax=Caldicellulosiruptor morganii TaxID=1387555 RepID=A0ABY7BK74_9FIRM|nr:response regulator [Caldicellulosiruptor morganii]WAM33243.1 response regulator [Caldicellulosiruptor morganii]